MKKTTFNVMKHWHVMAAGKTAAKEANDTTPLATLNKIITAKGLREAKILARPGKSGRWLNALLQQYLVVFLTPRSDRNHFVFDTLVPRMTSPPHVTGMLLNST